jgi:hypothetical protein
METILNQPRISTLMVEIKVIKIGNSKMTLSVFDQLYYDFPYNDDSKIIYPVWGKVHRSSDNYVIFIKNNELRKHIIPSKRHFQTFEIAVHYSTDGNEGVWHLKTVQKIYKEKKKWWDTMSYEDKVEFFKKTGSGNYWSGFPFETTSTNVKKFLDELTEEERDQVIDEYNTCVKNCKTYNDMIDQLNAANQLFIAV